MKATIKTLRIQEASERVGVAKPTLRFWEKELRGFIVPLRTKGGQRRYTEEHLLLFEEIKGAKKRGLTLCDIRRELDSRHRSGARTSGHQTVDVLADRIVEAVRSALVQFLQETPEGEGSIS